MDKKTMKLLEPPKRKTNIDIKDLIPGNIYLCKLIRSVSESEDMSDWFKEYWGSFENAIVIFEGKREHKFKSLRGGKISFEFLRFKMISVPNPTTDVYNGSTGNLTIKVDLFLFDEL